MDCDSELPVWKSTKPANVQDTTLLISLFMTLLEHVKFDIQAVMSDAAYDSEDDLKFVIGNLHDLPRIAKYLRWEKPVKSNSPLQAFKLAKKSPPFHGTILPSKKERVAPLTSEAMRM